MRHGEVYRASLSVNLYQIMLVIPSSSHKLIHHSYDWYLCRHIGIIVLLERLCHHTQNYLFACSFSRAGILTNFRFYMLHYNKCVLVLSLTYLYTVMPMYVRIYANCVSFFLMVIYISFLIFNVPILKLNLGLNRYISMLNYNFHVISEGMNNVNI